MPDQQSPIPAPLTFLKLGGSLITDKSQPSTARPEIITRIAHEIKTALSANPDLRLVIGHGSGSFGHIAAKKYGTRQGVETDEQWQGFAEVWHQASALNRIVVDIFQEVGLPVVSVAPSASITAQDGEIAIWNKHPIHTMLNQGLLPIIYGDVAFDIQRGGTILSTEDLFKHLALDLRPQRILLAGIEEGVWADYPANTQLIEHITPQNFTDVLPALGGSAHTDVTGGMASKVQEMLSLAESVEGLEISIFSGQSDGSILKALQGRPLGTRIMV
ncbi:MAG: isopentenyl phosphate kinase family protein [Chloroflexi bacterium]|nr:isopentenyl phosphate kinase family protein [Chloroflexota bacterium]